jgi:L,D-transpeptidase catalytic domain/Putative peptidoglycan binding domain
MKNKIRRTNFFVLISMIIFLTISPFSEVHSEKIQKIYIKVDLWTKELYVIEGVKVIKRYKISPGTEDSPTPIGTFMITKKSRSWGGGFGTRWLGLNVPWGEYGIHGTNKPWLIGNNVSSGCIRMRNEDVEELFEIVSEGTVVHIAGPITGIGNGDLKNLSLGSKGNLVQIVQERLKLMGFYHGKVNGIFDKTTERAVHLFQRVHHLPETGVVTKREYILLGILE